MADRKKEKKCEKGAAAWLLTYGDMTTLLLTFFILMFTVAEIDGHELKLILSSFTGSFGIMDGGLTLQPGPLAQMGMTVETLPSKKAAQKLSKALKEAQNEFKPEQKARRIRVSEDVRGLVISMAGQTYFEPDSAVIKPEGKRVLEKVARLILSIKANTGTDKQVEIEGHASLEPETVIDKEKFNISKPKIWKRNLQLSTDRAKNVEIFLIERFIEREVLPVIKLSDKKQIAKFVAKGYGEFQPLESNETPEERAWNRRVDIVIKRD